MRVPTDDEERPLAWSAILAQTPVRSRDGENVGTIHDVLGSEQEDVFHGIVVDQGVLGSNVFVPAVNVRSITNRQIEIDLTSEVVRKLTPYKVQESYTLGFTGLLRKHLGWVEDNEKPGQS